MARRRAFEKQDDGRTIVFTTLRDVSGTTPAKIVVDAPAEFGQSNETGGLRPVSSLEEVSDIAREAARRTRRLFGLTSE